MEEAEIFNKKTVLEDFIKRLTKIGFISKEEEFLRLYCRDSNKEHIEDDLDWLDGYSLQNDLIEYLKEMEKQSILDIWDLTRKWNGAHSDMA